MKIPNFLNSTFGLMILLVAITVTATSCDEEDETTILISVDDAAELVAFSLANRTYGGIYNLNYVADEVLELVDCNESQTNDRTVSDTSRDGEISVMYDITEEYSKTCEVTETVLYSFAQNQLLNSVRYDLDQAINGSWSIDGVQEGSAEITYNGPYNRSGSWTYNQEDNHTDDITYSSTFIDITYDPNSERITGGTSTFTLDGTSTVYESFSYAGDVVFLGSDISVITFQSGEQYELNLETGEVTEL